jgi:hypothetical protein
MKIHIYLEDEGYIIVRAPLFGEPTVEISEQDLAEIDAARKIWDEAQRKMHGLWHQQQTAFYGYRTESVDFADVIDKIPVPQTPFSKMLGR